MPRVDFDKVDSPEPNDPRRRGKGSGGGPIPPGEYLCRVEGVRERATASGDPMWVLRWEVAEGPHAGRLISDNIAFSERALPKLKLACHSLGVETSGEVELTSDDLMGRSCLVTVNVETTERGGRRNSVPFRGYRPKEG